MILASAEYLVVQDIARQVGIGRPAAWRRQQDFAEDGLNGPLPYERRPPGTPVLTVDTVRRAVESAMDEPQRVANR